MSKRLPPSTKRAKRKLKRTATPNTPAQPTRAAIVRQALNVLRIEQQAIAGLIPHINHDFVTAVRVVRECTGRVVVTGMGKAGLIARKISATMSSTGTPSIWMHPAEAYHGDLGIVQHDDVVICLSNSGETDEVTRLLPTLKRMGVVLIGITGKAQSTLAQHSSVVLNVHIREEACPLNLAPSASTTAMLAMGDALALTVADAQGFRQEDFARVHPGGALGKQLVRVEEIMRKGTASPVVKLTAKVSDVLHTITRARAGSACVIDARGQLAGIFTDGDLRRHVKRTPDLARQTVSSVMTTRPKVITKEQLAVEALRILNEYHIDELPVVDAKHRPIGLVDVQDLLKAGIV
jgi:arabinose-5-phosphate isomerase